MSLEAISEALQKGKAKDVKALVQEQLDAGVTAKAILEGGLMAGMDVVGRRFKANEIYVPEVLIAARAMTAGITILKPLLIDEAVEAKGTIVIGTVKGDLHDIGKNLVKMMMEGKGFNMIDLGTDVSAEQFVEAAKEHKANIICCSALLTTTMTEMKNVVAAVDAAGLRDTVKVMVGGAPITQEYCESIGADAYSPDAASAAEKALEFVGAA
jgi:corrinoid protein of di/trimethylamine methyltransferase